MTHKHIGLYTDTCSMLDHVQIMWAWLLKDVKGFFNGATSIGKLCGVVGSTSSR